MEPDPLESRLGHMLKQAQHALHRRMEAALRPVGLGVAHYAALAALARSPGASNAELARAAWVTPQSMQSVVAALELRGFIARSADPLHGRILNARLTEAGRALLHEAEAVIAPVEAALDAACGKSGRDDAHALLRRMRDAMADRAGLR